MLLSLNLQFPTRPSGWFCAGSVKQMKNGKLFTEVAGQEILLVRGENGAVSALSGRCCHMNTSLETASVNDGLVRCPLHRWVFDTSGKCVAIPGQNAVPPGIRLPVMKCRELWGHFFVLLGDDIPFPFFDGKQPEDYQASRLIEIEQCSDWWIGPANGFDLHHFEWIHGRKILAAERLHAADAHTYRARVEFEILPRLRIDRILRNAFSAFGSLDFSVSRGNVVVAHARLGSIENQMIFFNEPRGPGKSRARTFVVRPRARSLTGSVGNYLRLALQARMTRRFFRDEALLAEGIRVPRVQMPQDQFLVDYFKWLNDLYAQRPAKKDNFAARIPTLSLPENSPTL